jgi:CHAD domain-containing protein
VSQLLDHHAGVWLGDDPEHLHQFRVATRRLRSDLRTFAPLFDQRWTTWLRDELKWLGDEVGRGRDADVLGQRLRQQMTDLPGEDARAVELLLQRLEANSGAAREHVVAALSSDRYVELLDALVDAARHPHFGPEPPEAERSSREVMAVLVRKPWKKLRRAANALTRESPDTAFHAARIRAKRARYAAEAVAPLFGRRAERFADSVADVQTVLGEHQDTAVAETWLRQAGRALPATRVVVGELITLERLERLRLRQSFRSVWKRASRRKLRTWFT